MTIPPSNPHREDPVVEKLHQMVGDPPSWRCVALQSYRKHMQGQLLFGQGAQGYKTFFFEGSSN